MGDTSDRTGGIDWRDRFHSPLQLATSRHKTSDGGPPISACIRMFVLLRSAVHVGSSFLRKSKQGAEGDVMLRFALKLGVLPSFLCS